MAQNIQNRFRAYIGVGSNMGDAQGNCLSAIRKLDSLKLSKVIKRSSLYKTEPVGMEQQDWFVNCVAALETGLAPSELLAALQGIERDMGRIRTVMWGPRTIDLDILFYGDLVISGPDLRVPHPEIANRRFVLEPLCEIAPDLRHPLLGGAMRELLAALRDDKKVYRIP